GPTGLGEHLGRLVGVDVDADQVRVAHDERAVAHRGDLLADLLDVHVTALDQELRAVAPALFGELQRRLGGPSLGGRRRLQELVGVARLNGPQETFEDDLEAVAAGADDARLAQDGELSRGVVGGRLGRPDRGPDY